MRYPPTAASFRALYCKYKPVNQFAYNMTRVARFDWPRGNSAPLEAEPLIVTGSFDRSVNDMTISADSRTLYVTANEDGRVRLFAAPAKGGDVKALDRKSAVSLQVQKLQAGHWWQGGRTPTIPPR
jgi:hypothetical protein